MTRTRPPTKTRLHWRLAITMILAASLATLTTVVASPASAAVPGLTIVSNTSANNPTSPKPITATCPPGKSVLGSGAQITGGGGDVVIDDLVPSANTVFVTAYENHAGVAANWSVTAYAICANPLPGLTIVSNTSANNPTSPKPITATCPAGTRPVGSGAVVSNAFGEVAIDQLRPDAFGVTARGVENHAGFAANWKITAYAVCAVALPGQTIVSATTVANPGSPKGITAACPGGTVVVGSGARIQVVGGVGSGDVGIDSLRLPTPASVRANAVENHAGVAANWSNTAYAICATP